MAYKPKVTMPVYRSEKDEEWLCAQLMQLTPAHQIKARIAYGEAYKASLDSEPIEHKKENKARRESNQRLRKFVAACVASYREVQSNRSVY